MLRWIALSIGVGTVVAGMILTTLAAQRLTSQPHTVEDAIGVVLRQEGIANPTVKISHPCPPDPQLCQQYHQRYYMADVQISGPREAVGSLICRTSWQDCDLTLASLGLRAVRLPALVPEHQWYTLLRRWRHRLGV